MMEFNHLRKQAGRLLGILTVGEHSNIERGESLEGGCGKVDRGRVVAGWAGVLHGNVNGFALPGNPDLLTAVLGLGAEVSIGTVVESSDEVVVRVLVATGTSVTVLSVPGDAEIGVKK